MNGELGSFAAVLAHLGRSALAVTQIPAPPGRPWLCLTLPIGRSEPFVLRAALVASGELPIGALALTGNQLVLRQTLPLDGLLTAQLDQAVRGLAAVAAQLAAAADDPESPYAYLAR